VVERRYRCRDLRPRVAHGDLLHEFLSLHSNQRNDQYGDSLDNRMRFLLRVTKRLQAAMPDTLPMFVRISATDWAAGRMGYRAIGGTVSAIKGAW
jgi:2,4-dienoyl-CoA reductase-like NADH-dependent reductase (Old Yellow Enzyme family)